MRSSRRYIFIGIGAVIVIGAVVAGIVLSSQWNTPLGPSLGLPTRTATAVSQASPQLSEQAEAAQASETQATPTASPTPVPQPLCGGPEVMYIMAIGTDNANCYNKDCYYTGLADVIKVARIDFVTPKVTVLSLPRDLYVPIPDIEKTCHGVNAGKLNQAYYYGTPSEHCFTEAGGGPGLLARTLDYNFGLQIDHYAGINYTAFAKIVDAVGGVDLYLENPVDGRPLDPNDTRSDMGFFPAGQHHMDGEKALRFVRARKRTSDLAREDNQNLVLCALKKKILSPSVLPDVPNIITSLMDETLTDLSPAQISQLMCIAPQLKKENIIFARIPDSMMQATKVPYSGNITQFGFIGDPDTLRKQVGEFIDGTWPTVSDEKANTCPE